MHLDGRKPGSPRPGGQLVEWVLVTAILTLAIYLILQVLGGSIDSLLQPALELWRKLVYYQMPGSSL